jgi:hypothetical protein
MAPKMRAALWSVSVYCVTDPRRRTVLMELHPARSVAYLQPFHTIWSGTDQEVGALGCEVYSFVISLDACQMMPERQCAERNQQRLSLP